MVQRPQSATLVIEPHGRPPTQALTDATVSVGVHMQHAQRSQVRLLTKSLVVKFSCTQVGRLVLTQHGSVPALLSARALSKPTITITRASPGPHQGLTGITRASRDLIAVRLHRQLPAESRALVRSDRQGVRREALRLLSSLVAALCGFWCEFWAVDVSQSVSQRASEAHAPRVSVTEC